MRLIDADKLYDELKEVSKLKGTTDKGRERARYIAEFIDFLGDASTIEAIPIEWLREWARRYSYVDIVEIILSDYRKGQSNEDQGSC